MKKLKTLCQKCKCKRCQERRIDIKELSRLSYELSWPGIMNGSLSEKSSKGDMK